MKLLIMPLIIMAAVSFVYADDCGDIHLLAPISIQLDNHSGGTGQPGCTDDGWNILSRVDGTAEYYLGAGAEDDTFFMVLETPAPCSVHFVEFQWFDAGTADFFSAMYSDEALELYPDGTAPPRGSSPASPVGALITEFNSGDVEGTQGWETALFNPSEYIVGIPGEMEPYLFGVGFVKQDQSPRPLADNMSSKGINHTLTWFGGPWMAAYPYDWGAYNIGYD
ncbi:MAG: hypothetical protein H8E46_06075 [FCB group bacterium]|nr:hypothetical protein [FCB group bacterium]